MMFVPKIIPLFLLLLNVSCSEFSKDITYYQKQTGRQPPRPYNRQPSEPKLAQDRFDINDNRKEKSFDIDVSKSPNANALPEKQDKDKNSTIITLSSGFAVKSTNVNEKSISEDNLQIPVAVIYEEPVTQKIQKKILRRRKPNKQATNASVKDIKSITEPPTRPEHTTSTQKNTDNETTEKPSITTKQLLNDFKEQKKTRERAPVIPIIQSENRVFAHNGDFHYSYEGGDGTKAFEKGELKTFDDDKTGEAVVGGFSYTAKDGQDYSLSYTADENGYRPVGAHLPTPPPIPPAIERALRYLATKSTPEPVTDSISESE